MDHQQRPPKASLDKSPSAPDTSAGSAIGKRLKAYYEDVASEPVPDRFLSLLEQLDAAEKKTKSGTGE
ncbi:hypothetical protein FPY71_04305 [Aureimonas fodinaquatilis]|uniref:Anti-sigma factor NepR domain-containing protein n=1 Tax=Aureimonas fodinaquatilis TaxID=2565783 RepID=A0A5B0DZW0_9HYPH|nr:NepR family anti-sigma factor [Aureimonas fodinaquatilis]KAA0972327.1 hypothetical protein FPY71_04305 [Aureimonas fodinaquatilis]